MLKTLSAALAALAFCSIPVHAQAPAAPATSKPAANTPPDWTPLFKTWEKGCAYSPELSALLEGMKDKRVVVPPAYRDAVGKVSRRMEKGVSISSLAIQGTYYGLAVAAIENYAVPETDNGGVNLVFAASKQDVKKVLSRVKYRKVTDPDMGYEMEAMVLLDEKQARLGC